MNIEQIFKNNEKWIADKLKFDSDYFKNMALGQSPEILYIGCSDSRVTAEELMGVKPGEVFVHRNIANMVSNNDLSAMSVVNYAVSHLKVKHVIVCGHYGCGGIKAAMTNHDFKQVLNMWLRNIKDVYRLHREELEIISDEEERTDRLVELNVQEQVAHLAKTSIIQRAWKNEQRPHLHGWVYGLKDGLIKSVFEMEPNTHIDPLYEYDDL